MDSRLMLPPLLLFLWGGSHSRASIVTHAQMPVKCSQEVRSDFLCHSAQGVM